jgi:hypothetical protein
MHSIESNDKHFNGQWAEHVTYNSCERYIYLSNDDRNLSEWRSSLNSSNKHSYCKCPILQSGIRYEHYSNNNTSAMFGLLVKIIPAYTIRLWKCTFPRVMAGEGVCLAHDVTVSIF